MSGTIVDVVLAVVVLVVVVVESDAGSIDVVICEDVSAEEVRLEEFSIAGELPRSLPQEDGDSVAETDGAGKSNVRWMSGPMDRRRDGAALSARRSVSGRGVEAVLTEGLVSGGVGVGTGMGLGVGGE